MPSLRGLSATRWSTRGLSPPWPWQGGLATARLLPVRPKTLPPRDSLSISSRRLAPLAALSGASGPSGDTDDDASGDVIGPPLLANLPYAAARRVRRYFRANPWRRALFGGIALFLGFYAAQTVSLTLGALSLNDVIAAAFCVVFTESVTRYYHGLERPLFPQALLNTFKMGFTYGLIIDAFKLAS